ncbi:RNA 3'-terminal phosphate cyclase [Lujinxingia sediminis]|uniref:RNA 3'-terminal phosphate cyclase n=1 Tax=Lujinxingia sediminis TaxID=2480984 RepID=A0ABY0CU15_9DELT|nr:RNA 3'-terminal phosphate cyclase [Lujinxingia sediminis]RVU45817.1 RNA 3'-terminal phosphate cyclase [Lujinxingia sediminis]
MTTIHTPDPILIDGSAGEGGGQMLRSALTMAMLTGRPFAMEKIRAGRRRSGLLRQHLTCVRAATAICNAEVEGATLGSQSLRFTPGDLQGGDFRFEVGSAGSAMLVLQTVLLPLALGGQPATLSISGGTHNPAAPPFEFIARTYLKVLREAGLSIEAELRRPGFMPAGGGEVFVRFSSTHDRPGVVQDPHTYEAIAPSPALNLRARGALLDASLEALIAHIPTSIAEREIATFLSAAPPLPDPTLGWSSKVLRHDASPGPGNALIATLNFEHVSEVFFIPGQKGVSAEAVAERLADELRTYLGHDAPVGEHLTDQLLVVLAALGRGRFRCGPLSSHARTQLELLPRFTGREFEVSARGDGTFDLGLESE